MAGRPDDAGSLDRVSGNLQNRHRFRISAEPSGLIEATRELLAARDLFALLLGRELRVRFKQTVLGLAWVILQPLVPALIFAVVFGSFARLPSSGSSYLLFAFSGMVVYTLFSSAASRAGGAFIRDAALLTKVHFPRALLPLAAGASAVIDFGVGLVVLMAMGLVLGVIPGAPILAIPIIGLAALVLGLGLGLTVAALSARYRDFAIALPFLLQLLLYASPVVYSTELIPQSARDIYALNPLVALIESFRWAALGTPAPSMWHVGAGLLTGTVATVLGVAIYRRQARDITDVI